MSHAMALTDTRHARCIYLMTDKRSCSIRTEPTSTLRRGDEQSERTGEENDQSCPG